MTNKIFLFATFIFSSLSFTSATHETPAPEVEKVTIKEVKITEPSAEEKVELLYENFLNNNENMPALAVFSNGITGYEKLKAENKIQNELLTIVDFGLPSTEKRMWILDMITQKVLFHTYVAHGRNTGGNMATEFSNTPESFQSSLGFYVTAETYYGGNGLSLFIDGMEEEFNSKARERYVVIHGADYATEDFINRAGRLGRSYGCPAVPMGISKEIINTIKGGSALFVFSQDKNYLENSEYLNS